MPTPFTLFFCFKNVTINRDSVYRVVVRRSIPIRTRVLESTTNFSFSSDNRSMMVNVLFF